MTTLDEMRTRQQPLDSGFGYRTDAHTVLAGHDLTGTTAVVTGGYSGLGLETVKALADAGARVIVPARRPEAAAATLADVPQATVAAMELSDLTSVAAFTESLRDTGDTVNLLVNAAGVMATPEQVTAQGWEFQFGTNHLGHFALTAGLAPLLADGARVVPYSSVAHFSSPVRFDDINFAASEYDPLLAYGQSKAANALFAVALDACGAARGIHAYSDTPAGRDALALGVRAAHAAGATLNIVVVRQAENATPPQDGFTRYLEATIDTWLDKAGDKARATLADDQVRVHQRLDESTAQGLFDAASDLGAEVIFVGGAKDGLRGRLALSSLASVLVHASPVAVALAPRKSRKLPGRHLPHLGRHRTRPARPRRPPRPRARAAVRRAAASGLPRHPGCR